MTTPVIVWYAASQARGHPGCHSAVQCHPSYSISALQILWWNWHRFPASEDTAGQDMSGSWSESWHADNNQVWPRHARPRCFPDKIKISFCRSWTEDIWWSNRFPLLSSSCSCGCNVGGWRATIHNYQYRGQSRTPMQCKTKLALSPGNGVE